MLKRHETWKMKELGDLDRYRVAESPRVMPCDHWVPDPKATARSKRQGDWVPCNTPIRVKIKEPGVYSRLCPKCEGTTHYQLSEYADQPGVLMFRWMSEAQVVEHMVELGKMFDNGPDEDWFILAHTAP